MFNVDCKELQAAGFRLTIRNVNITIYPSSSSLLCCFRLTIRNVNFIYVFTVGETGKGFRLTIRNVNLDGYVYFDENFQVLD